MVWATTKDQNERQNDKSDQDNHFERGKPELELAEEADAKIVDDNDGDPKYGNENPRIDSISIDPVLYDESARCELIWRCDDVLEPVTTACQFSCMFNNLATYVYPMEKPRAGSTNLTA